LIENEINFLEKIFEKKKTPGAMSITTRGKSKLLLIDYKIGFKLILSRWSMMRD
jgi:hypothetical protein